MTSLLKIEMIESYMLKNNLSKSSFCKLCKIDWETLKKIYSGENIRLITVYKIASVLKVRMSELIN